METVIRQICLDRLEEYKESQDFFKFFNKFCERYQEMEDSLADEKKELFKKIMALRDEMDAESGITHFEYGFKLGLALGAECFK